ncbi:hypothetical protein Mal15_43630 [Stieleria maiorica]|uniref:Planctomycete cytochrome C n=1 Tax=Stieleria maiorica TaxID=2795974 RepID=A0A5B9MG96_9BACT|nr:DUF1549 and DUF1553 domain-containing protein [Stieleria maiorica]QEG00293.1 hypothetical protein Mal15_43630 [Stieleria maiorica]
MMCFLARFPWTARLLVLGWFATTLTGAVADDPGHDAVTEVEEEEISDFDRNHWAFQPIVRPALPAVKQIDWPQTAIDRFILARLEKESLDPAPMADRATLIRRLCWDLTGLPPTVDQVQRFVSDPRPGAYARLVDSLLASPEYGKHWGQFWLDLARYADTDGFEHDKIREQAWRYRDWVIDAINRDLPYDTFLRWQLAGDLDSSGGEDATTATAFCLSGPDMPDINSMDQRRHVLLNEITSTVGSVILGLQFGCAQCHDHKYDAISQADFYRLRAFFDSSIRLRQNQSVSVLASYDDSPRTHLMIRGDWRRKGSALNPAFPRIVNEPDATPSSDASPRGELADWITDRSNPLTARVFVNRIWQQHFGTGLVATPSDFGVMGDSPTHPQLLDYLSDELMRSDWSIKRLQRMIVMSGVYRVSGSRPTEGPERGFWDRSLAADPDNRWLSRFPRRRLDAEAIRDGLLAVSGSLNHEMGGPGVRPTLPAEMIKTLKSGQWKVTPSVDDHHRRSIYIFARRNLRYPFFATFDRPTADQPCARRNQSTTAIQSLTLLNSELMVKSSERLASAVSAGDADVNSQIDSLYLRLYSRSPGAAEVKAATAFLAGGASLRDLCRAMLNSNEFLYVD